MRPGGRKRIGKGSQVHDSGALSVAEQKVNRFQSRMVDITKPATLHEAEDRVQYIMRLMPHSWRRGQDVTAFATMWGVTESAIQGYAAEAWRRVQASDPQWVGPYLASQLNRALEVSWSLEKPKEQVECVCKVIQTWAPLTGLARQQVKIEVGPPDGTPDPIKAVWALADRGDPSASRKVMVWMITSELDPSLQAKKLREIADELDGTVVIDSDADA
jgi:hypothetical protein